MKWLALFLPFLASAQNPDTMHHPLTLLALGDSYTIGEALPLTESFPYQTVQLLRKEGKAFAAPEIIAKTGWTTDELQATISQHQFLPKYDFVTLLIGVNNQYRGQPVASYKPAFEKLLQQAIAFAGGKTSHVTVLSIPDYSVTPFARELDKVKIEKEIDEYNTLNRAIAVQYKVNYIDITPGTREAKEEESLIAGDGLHPSAKAYSKWAEMLFKQIAATLKN